MNTIEFFKSKTNYKLFYENCICIYVYPYQYLQIRKSIDFYTNADYVLLDGMMLTFLFNFFKVSANRRMSIDFSGIADDLLSYIANNKKTVYFIGAKNEEMDAFLANIYNKYPAINCVGRHHGYIKNDKLLYEKVIDEVVDLNPQFLLCGMGSPLQEGFLFDLKSRGWRGTGYSCGGFIYQTSLSLKYYPNWVNKLKLRWLYRGIYEPKALLKTLRIPLFIIVFLCDLTIYKMSKSVLKSTLK